jgi:hypothetical protein
VKTSVPCLNEPFDDLVCKVDLEDIGDKRGIALVWIEGTRLNPDWLVAIPCCRESNSESDKPVTWLEYPALRECNECRAEPPRLLLFPDCSLLYSKDGLAVDGTSRVLASDVVVR